MGVLGGVSGCLMRAKGELSFEIGCVVRGLAKVRILVVATFFENRWLSDLPTPSFENAVVVAVAAVAPVAL